MNQQLYDYSKFETITRDSSPQVIYEALSGDCKHFFGIHYINDQMEIDIERYGKACNVLKCQKYIPKQMYDEKKQYFHPTHKKKSDYNISFLLSNLESIKKFWHEEYKPAFNAIQSPKQVEDSYRVEALMSTSCSDDYDDIMVDAVMEGFKRQKEYTKIIQDLYSMFICRMCIEIDRSIMLVMNRFGHNDDDFSYEIFLKHFSKNNTSDKHIGKLEGYCAFFLLHRVYNFIKHNSVKAYSELQRQFPKNVRSIENGNAICIYENGMNALDWIVVKPDFIDNSFKKLPKFFKDYCHCVFNEDYERIDWDNEEYFEEAVENMTHYFWINNYKNLCPIFESNN